MFRNGLGSQCGGKRLLQMAQQSEKERTTSRKRSRMVMQSKSCRKHGIKGRIQL